MAGRQSQVESGDQWRNFLVRHCGAKSKWKTKSLHNVLQIVVYVCH